MPKITLQTTFEGEDIRITLEAENWMDAEKKISKFIPDHINHDGDYLDKMDHENGE